MLNGEIKLDVRLQGLPCPHSGVAAHDADAGKGSLVDTRKAKNGSEEPWGSAVSLA